MQAWDDSGVLLIARNLLLFLPLLTLLLLLTLLSLPTLLPLLPSLLWLPLAAVAAAVLAISIMYALARKSRLYEALLLRKTKCVN